MQRSSADPISSRRSAKLRRLVEVLAEKAPVPGTSIDAQRRELEEAVAKMPLRTSIVRTPVDVAGIEAEWADPPTPAQGVILYLHGGGYALGSIATVRPLAGHLAEAGHARVLSLEYRLAPEHPYPAAVDDVIAAYQWLLWEGCAPSRIVLAGDSAGGGLAVAGALAIRDLGLPQPAGIVGLSPWCDLSLSGASLDRYATADPQVRRWRLAEMADHYLQGTDPREPLVSPAFAELRGLPSMLIHVGSTEALADDADTLAARASAAGVDVTIDRWDDMIHVWHAFAPVLEEAVAAIAAVGEWLDGRWAQADTTGAAVP